MSILKRTSYVSAGLLVAGAIGYFMVPRNSWLLYLFAHLGALGLMGLSGSAAGALAQRKSRDFRWAFALGAILPIAVGVVGVLIFLWGVSGQLHCGGSVCLAIAVLVLLFYLVASRKAVQPAARSGLR